LRRGAREEWLGAPYWESLDAMIAEVDIVSLHTPLNRATHHILGAERLSRMKQDAFVVNVSRPALLDEKAMIAEIERGHLSGAALDVFENRNGIDPELLRLARENRVVL